MGCYIKFGNNNNRLSGCIPTPLSELCDSVQLDLSIANCDLLMAWSVHCVLAILGLRMHGLVRFDTSTEEKTYSEKS